MSNFSEMSFGDYYKTRPKWYDLSSQKANITKFGEKILQRFDNNIISQNDCNILSELYTALYYGKSINIEKYNLDKTWTKIQQEFNKFGDRIEQEIKQKEGIDNAYHSGAGNIIIESIFQKGQKLKDEELYQERTRKYWYNLIIKHINQCRTQLNNLHNLTKKELDTFYNRIKHNIKNQSSIIYEIYRLMQNTDQNLISQEVMQQYKNYISISATRIETYQIDKRLDAMENIAESIVQVAPLADIINLTNNDTGLVGELGGLGASLIMFNESQGVEQLLNYAFGDGKSAVKPKQWQGSSPVGQESQALDAHLDWSIKYEKEKSQDLSRLVFAKDSKKRTYLWNDNHELSLGLNTEVSDENRFGKTDFTIELSQINGFQSNNQAKISYKNWTGVNDELRDFGSTSLYRALMRTFSASLMGAELYGGYLYTMGVPRVQKKDQIMFHNLAKCAIAADTIMGYSQKSQYANVLMLNRQSHKTVEVYSIYDIMKYLIERLEELEMNFSISGYNTISIQNEIKQIYKLVSRSFSHSIGSSGRSRYYRWICNKYLNTINPAIKYINLQPVLNQVQNGST